MPQEVREISITGGKM